MTTFFKKVMEQKSNSLYAKAYHPVAQAAVCLIMGLVISLGGKLFNSAGIMEVGQRFPWMSAAAFMLFFALFNSVFSLSADNPTRYWQRSIYSFMGLALGAGLIAWGLSGLTVYEAGSYRWIFIVVTIGYLVFISMMNIMKKIVGFAQREEWNHPRLRRRK